MLTDIVIRPASPGDWVAITQLLVGENLPIADLRPDLADFFLALRNDKAIAAIGLDHYGRNGLLRSMVVDASFRNHGIAGKLAGLLEDHARGLGISTLYLITNTAAEYFRKKGFLQINRDQLPEDVQGSAEFNGLCPASSTIMRKLI